MFFNCTHRKEFLGKDGKEMCAAADISGHKTNHSLRATGASYMFQAGVPEKLIQQRTGQCSLTTIWTYHHWTAKSSLSDRLSWQWRNLQEFQHQDPKVQYYLQCILHLAKACHATNSTSSTHEFWWVQCCHLSRVQFSLCSISCYHPAYYSCWQAWGQHQWYWLGDFHQWLLNTVDFLCIVLHCAIMLTFTLLHYSVLGFCMVTFGNWICNTANWVNKLIINYVPMLISRYKRQHLIIHQLPTLTTGSNIPHTCGGGLAHLWVHNKHSNHLYSNGK